MRRKIFTLTLLGVLLSAGGILMITGNTQISQTERRQLAQWTRPTKQGILSGSWMDAAEQAAADQFPLRDLFRQGKAQFVYHVLLQADHDGIYFRNGSAAKLDYPLDEASVSHLLDVMLRIQQKYLNGTSVRVYYSIIPDKKLLFGRLVSNYGL